MNKSIKIIIAGIATIFVLIIAFSILYGVAINQNNGSSSSKKNITIDYLGTKQNTLIWTGDVGGYSYTEKPDTGKTFLVCDIKIQNNGYESFSTNPYYFELVADSIKYSFCAETFYLDNWDTVDLLDSGSYEGTIVFEISESASSFSLDYNAWVESYNIIWNQK